jgi:hypothetical protein
MNLFHKLINFIILASTGPDAPDVLELKNEIENLQYFNQLLLILNN